MQNYEEKYTKQQAYLTSGTYLNGYHLHPIVQENNVQTVKIDTPFTVTQQLIEI